MTTARKKLGVLVSGGGTNLQSVLDAVNGGGINGGVAVVISSNAGAYALERAKKNNIPAVVASLKDFSSREERDAFILKTLKEHNVDYVLLAGYLGILTPPLIRAYENRILNIHPALLPKFGGASYHGLNVHKAVLAAGEKVSGATVHFVDEHIDTGLIISQESLEILSGDTPESLQERILNTIEHTLFVRVVKDLCDGKITVDNGRVCYKK